ncbi:LPS 1,2-glucosyltransferase [Synergistales bacterium]|nr:LPS 1,2-glucosyltransferase [Synergistales bacterium]
MDTVHVVLAVCDPKGTYSRHAGVVMTSVFEHTKSRVCVHILHDETLTGGNRARFEETAGMYGQSVEFHDLSPLMERVRTSKEILRLVARHSIGSLFRMAISDILNIDKVIYLDSDVVVNMDILELWNISLDGYSLAGVLDGTAYVPHRLFSADTIRLKLMKLKGEKYINAGVLSMNLSRIRERNGDLIHRGFLWLRHYCYCAIYADQDFFNSCFSEDIKLIDGRFNNMRGGDCSNSIPHALGDQKPWNCIKGLPIERLYWKIWLKTPWGRLSPDEIVDSMIDTAKDSILSHRHTAQCYKKIFSRLWKDIICNNIVMIIWLYAKKLYYRVIVQA